MKPKIDMTAIQAEWDVRLAKSGFKDIENRTTGQLTMWAPNCMRGSQNIQFRSNIIDETEQYYRAAGEVLNHHHFDSKFEQLVWELHCSGQSTREIARTVGSVNHVSIFKIIKKISDEFVGIKDDLNVITNVLFRDGLISDANFIYSSWLHPLYYDNEENAEIDKAAFMAYHNRRITQIFTRAHIKVACLVEDPEVILGYAVYEANKLWWVYVKKFWRAMGIAKKLVPSHIDSCAYLTRFGKDIKPVGWKVIPYFKEEIE